MQFRRWLLLQESIVVNTGREEVPLGKSKDAAKVVEFAYSADTYYSAYDIWPFAEDRPGYVNTGNATVIGVIKKTPIFPGNGADRSFINSLTASLKASGYKPLPYREGDSEWMGAFKDAGADEDIIGSMKGEKEFNTAEAPKMGQDSKPQRKVSPGISVSRASGSWAYFVRVNPGDTDFYIRTIERMMRDAAKPLLDNDLIDYYRVVRGWDYKKEEVVWSEKGKRERDEGRDFSEKAVAYIKFLADRMLSNRPNAKKAVLGYFRNSWNKDIQPRDERVPFEDLRLYIRDNHSESPFLNFFLDALQSKGDLMYDVLESAASTNDHDGAVSAYKEVAGDEYEYMMDEPRLWLHPALKILSLSDMMTKHARSQFEKFKREYEEAINGWLSSGAQVRPGEVELLSALADHLDITDRDRIKAAHSEKKRRDEDDYKELLRQREINDAEDAKTKQMIKRGEFKYLMVGKDSEWRDIPKSYINGHDEVDVGLMALEEDLVDRENLLHAAHEKASEEAWEDAEQRKSETYGKDRDEVESDIDDEWDEYMDDREFDEGEFDGMSDDQKRDKIKRDYLDDFVGWKIDRLKSDEEEESWKYEPEPDDSKIRKYEEEFAEEQAYEDGLVVMRWVDDDHNEIEVSVHPKHFAKAREMVRKSIAIGLQRKDKYGEPLISKSQMVQFLIVADDGDTKDMEMRAREV